VPFARNTAAIINWPDKHSADVLLWFSQGKYMVEQAGDTLKFFNVKWGIMDFRETEADKAIAFYYELYPDGVHYQVEMRQMNLTKDKFWSAWNALWAGAFGRTR
jgi:hypothetical protein